MNPLFAVWLAAGALVVPAVAVFIVSWRRLVPRGESAPVPAGLERAHLARIEVPAPAGRLTGWRYAPPGATRGTVVLVHGWGSHAEHMLTWSGFLAEAGWITVAVNLRGHGDQPPEPMSFPKLAEDITAVIAWTAAHDGEPPVLLGHSLGGAAALLAVARGAPVRGVVISSAFARIRTLTDHVLRAWKLPPALFGPVVAGAWRLRLGHGPAEHAPERTVPTIRGPLLLTHGLADPLIPESELACLAAVAPRARILEVPGAAHSDLVEFPVYRCGVIGFLEELEGTRRAGHG